MRIKERWRQEAFIRSAKAQDGDLPTMIIQLPVAMADLKQYPGADRTILASVYAMDGKAVVVPATRRCGILVVEWSKLMRYLRRRFHGSAWNANRIRMSNEPATLSQVPTGMWFSFIPNPNGEWVYCYRYQGNGWYGRAYSGGPWHKPDATPAYILSAQLQDLCNKQEQALINEYSPA